MLLSSHKHLLLGGSCGTICPGVFRVQRPDFVAQKRSRRQHTVAVGWDPEGILRPPEGGHISRRILRKEVEKNEELQAEVARLKAEKEEELRAQREARATPETHGQLVEYFLETESGEMQYETARMRPLLTEDFFDFLKTEISNARFASSPSQERVAELEGLRNFLQDAVKLIDSKAQEIAAPAERMKRLLTAPDKKAVLYDMAGNNEIDKPLLDLMQQNIDAARAAGQDGPATFMEKVRDAAKKFQKV